MRLVDSHGHVQADDFDADRAAVLDSARTAGVERLLAPGWDLASSEQSLALARTHDWLDASAGVHPHLAARVSVDDWRRIGSLAQESRIVAIGETGLDHDRAFSPREAQLHNLRRHLELARRTGKPLILHCRSRPGQRDAQDELIAELRAAGLGGGDWRAAFVDRPPGVLHSFSGPRDYGLAALELGLAVSFSGLVFRRGQEPSAEVARLAPADRLLVETDAPYLSVRGAPRRNEPRWVEVTARWLAEERGEDPEALGAQLVANYERIFRPAGSGSSSTSQP